MHAASASHSTSWPRRGRAFDRVEIERRLAASPAPRWLWFVHCETSTGVLNDLDGLRGLCAASRIGLCVDAISSIGTVPVSLEGIQFASGVSGKGLGAFPGLAMVFYRDDLRPAPSRLPRYLDLGLYASSHDVPFTHSSNLLRALHTAPACRLGVPLRGARPRLRRGRRRRAVRSDRRDRRRNAAERDRGSGARRRPRRGGDAAPGARAALLDACPRAVRRGRCHTRRHLRGAERPGHRGALRHLGDPRQRRARPGDSLPRRTPCPRGRVVALRNRPSATSIRRATRGFLRARRTGAWRSIAPSAAWARRRGSPSSTTTRPSRTRCGSTPSCRLGLPPPRRPRRTARSWWRGPWGAAGSRGSRRGARPACTGSPSPTWTWVGPAGDRARGVRRGRRDGGATYVEADVRPLWTTRWPSRGGSDGSGRNRGGDAVRAAGVERAGLHARELDARPGDPATDPRVFCIGPSARDGAVVPLARSTRPPAPLRQPWSRDALARAGRRRGRPVAAPGIAGACHAESSGASAIAAGVVALVLAANPTLRLRERDVVISRTAVPIISRRGRARLARRSPTRGTCSPPRRSATATTRSTATVA